jgi:hypothetical protein
MYMRSWAVLVATLVVAGCGTHDAILKPSPGASSLPVYYNVELDPVLGTPRYVANAHSEGMYQQGAPSRFSNEEAFRIVKDFVTAYAPVFRFRPGTDGFVATWALGSDGVNFVKVTQTYLGLEVEAMGYGTSVLPNGEVGSMIGRFLPDIHLITIPLVAAETAGRTSIAALLPATVRIYGPPRRIVWVADDYSTRLVWSTIVAQGWLTWTVRVDAQTGKVLSVQQNWVTN